MTKVENELTQPDFLLMLSNIKVRNLVLDIFVDTAKEYKPDIIVTCNNTGGFILGSLLAEELSLPMVEELSLPMVDANNKCGYNSGVSKLRGENPFSNKTVIIVDGIFTAGACGKGTILTSMADKGANVVAILVVYNNSDRTTFKGLPIEAIANKKRYA